MSTSAGRLLSRGPWWFGRFRVLPGHAAGHVSCRDMLMPSGKAVEVARFAGLAGRALDQALFRHGFTPSTLGPAFGPVADAPRSAEDALFWQFPCRTEGAAWEVHAAATPSARRDADEMHLYLGLPWATWIDKRRKLADAAPEAALQAQLRRTRVRLSGLRAALESLGMCLRVHTVCQHVYWRDLLPEWQALGLTDVWLSHCPDEGSGAAGALRLHPWRLFAVNVEDPARREGWRPGRDPGEKGCLASFVGAHADHYVSDVRARLSALADEPGFVIRVTGQWHFEDVVYRHQMTHSPLAAAYRVDESVASYNALLSDSVFSLCPSGAGPNTLRLWESLATGSIPVLLGVPPVLPRGGSLPPIDWDQIVLRVPDERLHDLPALLRSIPLDEVRQRQRLGLQAFEHVRAQRCF